MGCLVCCNKSMFVPTVCVLLIQFLSQFFIDQMNRDEHVKQLVLLLDAVFDFLTQASQLETLAELASSLASSNDHSARINVQIKILILLCQQTAECVHFICDYAEHTSYCQSSPTYHVIYPELYHFREADC